MPPSQESFGPFEATHWPLVEQAAHSNPVFRQAALADLLQRYRPALRAHLVFKRQLDRQTAEDVLQGFISDKILERNILRLADQSRGQFRLLLLKSLDNYLRDEWRRAARRVETAAMIDESAEPVIPINETDVFEIAWARQVLTQVLARMRGECEAGARTHVWEIFLSRVWLAAVSDRDIESYDSLVDRLGLESPAQASNLLMAAKRQFRRNLEEVVAEYVVEPAAVEFEVAELQRILAAGRNVLLGLPFDQEAETAPPSAAPISGSARSVDVSLSWPCHLKSTLIEGITWNKADLPRLLKHQLGLPLESLTSLVPNGGTPDITAMLEREQQPSLLDLFTSANPSLESLEQVKVLCKGAAQAVDPTLPKEVATILYYAAIAAAKLRKGESISSASPEALAEGLFRVLAIPWCDPQLKQLFAETYLALRS